MRPAWDAAEPRDRPIATRRPPAGSTLAETTRAASSKPPSCAWAPAGFTLAEMLVSLVAAGLLGAALFGLVASQSRFHQRNEDAVQAGHTVRTLAEGMSAEIRGAGPGDLLQATADTVSFRADVLRAVVCDSAGSDGADLFVYDSISANLRTRWRGTAASWPYREAWSYADGATLGSSVSAQAEAACRAAGTDSAGRARARQFRRTSGWQGIFGAAPRRGTLVRVYGQLTYAIRPSTSEPGTLSLRRNGQEYALPLQAGASFEYTLADGRTLTRVSPSDFAQVTDVRLLATAIGRNRRTPGREFGHAVRLRN